MFKHFIKLCQKSFQSMQTRQKILLGYSVPLSLMIVVAGVVYYNIGEMLEDAKWVQQHTQEVIASGEELSKLMIDMETGERGFLITGKENFLEPLRHKKYGMTR